VRFLPLN